MENQSTLRLLSIKLMGIADYRARELLGLKRSQCGAVTFVQRFNSALGLNVHFHVQRRFWNSVKIPTVVLHSGLRLLVWGLECSD